MQISFEKTQKWPNASKGVNTLKIYIKNHNKKPWAKYKILVHILATGLSKS